MSGHHRLRLSRDSALRLVEWRLQQERRRTHEEHREPDPARAKRRRLGQLAWLSIGGAVLVWGAIKLSGLDPINRPVEIAIGILFVALFTSALIVALAALTLWRPQTRRGGA